ncbi:nucleotidyltransferase family protein [Terriglobus sp.]|uniref:nucleotidyltransferase family protein n=1 Tax=Terriglobus sp. TaxID=1889013 RepID=UPI003B00782A
MTRDRALQILRDHEADFRASGVAHLRLFGSVARDEAGPESDVDILADFDPTRPEAKFQIGTLQQDLEGMLGVHVDLSVESWLKPLVRVEALREQVYAF